MGAHRNLGGGGGQRQEAGSRRLGSSVRRGIEVRIALHRASQQNLTFRHSHRYRYNTLTAITRISFSSLSFFFVVRLLPRAHGRGAAWGVFFVFWRSVDPDPDPDCICICICICKMYVAKTLFYLSSLSHWMIRLTSRHSEQIYTQSTAAAAATASVRVRAGCTSVLAGSHSGCDAAGHGLDAVVAFGEPAGGCGDSDGFRTPLPPLSPAPLSRHRMSAFWTLEKIRK